MALEELIVAWSNERPAWQREVMRRVALGERLSDDDYDQLVEGIMSPKADRGAPFGLEHLTKAAPDDPSVRLVSIAEPKHVNALASDQPLTFELVGLTIVYGDNGSGKSGYARLLKRIARARHREDVLSDIFRDTMVERPTASLSVRIGDKEESFAWRDSASPTLQRMLFYDAACGSAYIATESDFPYRPAALFAMDGLIEACVAVRTRLDAKLDENARSAATMPFVADEAMETEAARYLSRLSGGASVEDLDALITRFNEWTVTIDDLKNEEASLRSADNSRERQSLTRQAEKLEVLHKHSEKIHSIIGDAGLTAIQERRDQLKALDEAASVLARSFGSEPLPGVGTSPWKALWESAKRFSEAHAYPAQSFPVVDVSSRCVLCQQALAAEGQYRLSRFENFVKDDTQVRLDEARKLYAAQVANVTNLLVSPEAVTSIRLDLEVSHTELMAELRMLLENYEQARRETCDTLAGEESVRSFGIESPAIVSRLAQAAKSAREEAESLSDPEIVQKRLSTTMAKRQEAELLQQIKNSRGEIVKEIARLKEREILEAAKAAAATGTITKKVVELSEEGITEVVRDAFTRETDRLRLERVTIARTRADRGALLHQPKLIGARQEASLPRVFSEGERSALGLAAFFTEAQLDASKSALILDDPVTSLDHIRRGLVAARLAAFAESRQVVIFTHDVAFVADLRREADARAVLVSERSVKRSRAEDRKPGTCGLEHPWKAKDVPARLNELRQDLTRIKRECGTCSEKAYEDAVAVWAGNLSETWERIFSQEIVGRVLAEGGLEVRPMMVKILASFSNEDHREFESSYSRVSQWAKRHDKSPMMNYVAPEVDKLEEELNVVNVWFKRVKGYKA